MAKHTFCQDFSHKFRHNFYWPRQGCSSDMPETQIATATKLLSVSIQMKKNWSPTLVVTPGPSQKFAEACETNNVSFFLNPSLPLEMNGNRKTGFNVPLRKGSAYFPERGKMKLHSRVVRKQQIVEKIILKNHKRRRKERKSQEGEIISMQSQNNGVKWSKYVQEGFSIQLVARSSANQFAAGLGGDFHFFNFWFEACSAKTVETPSPQTNALRFASFCELLQRPLTEIDDGNAHQLLTFNARFFNINEIVLAQHLLLFSLYSCVVQTIVPATKWFFEVHQSITELRDRF